MWIDQILWQQHNGRKSRSAAVFREIVQNFSDFFRKSQIDLLELIGIMKIVKSISIVAIKASEGKKIIENEEEEQV